MKTIVKIAKTELRNLFYSPVAWFLALAFLVQCAVFYTYALFPYAQWQEINMTNNPKFKDFGTSMTSTIFLAGNGIFTNVLQNLYLFIPLLTMGLISREVNNGTIKLLYSSPVKLRKIVLGKYLAVMLYNLMLVLIVGIFIVTGSFNIHRMDWGLLLSAELGLYLLLCAYTAIGLFMSSLTTYQIISALGSFLVIFILSRIGTLWQKYDFVRDLTYFLSISGRTSKMLRGLITTKDIIYFGVIVYIFMAFTLIKLRGGRESKPWPVKAARYIGVFVSALVIGYISSRPTMTLYWDTTALQFNTLHPNIQKVVKEMGKEPLEITLYDNLLGPGVRRALPEQRNNYLSFVWEPYIRFKPDIDFKYDYYYDLKPGDSTLYKSFRGKNIHQIAQQMAKGYEADFTLFKKPEEMRKTIDLEPENHRVVMLLKYKGRSTFLRTFDDPLFWPEDMEIAAAFKRLLMAKMPKVYFITGNLERNIYKTGEREYSLQSVEKAYRSSLVNIGFDADTLSLDYQDIPADAKAVVLADPKTELSATTRSKISQFIAHGGNMLILGQPGKQQMINPVLQELGVQLMPGNLVQPSRYEMPQMVIPYITDTAANLADNGMLMRLREARKEKDYDDTLKQIVPGPTALSYDSNGAFKIEPLLMTQGNKTWLKQGPLVTDSADIIFDPKAGDVKGSFPVAVQLTRQLNNRQQRIIVCSNADFMSNLRSGGSFLGVAFYSWLDYNEFPFYGPRPKARDGKLNISPGGANALIGIYVWAVPALVLILGAILLIRRNRE